MGVVLALLQGQSGGLRQFSCFLVKKQIKNSTVPVG